MNELKKLTIMCQEFPSGLVGANIIAEKLGISEERVTSLADAGYWPHYRFDGGSPQFKITESKQWSAQNLMQKIEGKLPDFEFK